MRTKVVFAIIFGFATLVYGPSLTRAQNNLVLDGSTMSLSGIQRFDNVCLLNGATITVPNYTGGSKSGNGNLELIAGSIYIDATSQIEARGSGYQSQLCSDGPGPNATAGGRGGCSVMDSGGGGAHFGRGGRGTVDNPKGTNNWQSGTPALGPSESMRESGFEDDCDIDFDDGDDECDTIDTDRNLCWTDGVDDVAGTPFTDTVGRTVAGQQYWHNIYDPEFGAAGGDKGCRDEDSQLTDGAKGGAGGGRVVLVALSERNPAAHAQPTGPCADAFAGSSQGKIRIEGLIDANGKRGCGIGNDSGGGGAGGTVLIVGQNVAVGSAAVIRAAGGLGGDTRAGAMDEPDYTDCPGAQTSGTCDDCGGGGGGGIISVLSVASDFDPGAQFNVNGAVGGVCTICNGEAGGGAGELQLDGAYVGEYCDGFDNDFDGMVDENLGMQNCGLGNCQQSILACENNAPKSCMPMVDPGDASCSATAVNARPRIALILDTSASMLLDLQGYPTFGDGSVERPGIGSTGGIPDDSRLKLAREALAQVISAYPEIDFALARYHQDQGLNRSCQNAKWFECQGLVATYDDPTMNTGTLNPACSVKIGPGMSNVINVPPIPGPVDSQCINYAGSCGPPRRGADVLSGFGSKVRDMVRWLDGRETNFSDVVTTGDVCQHSDGLHDCEVRGSGPTPLAGSLLAIEDYVAPIRAVDSAAACRGYSVILLTDGAESCNGIPAAAAQRLHDVLGIEVYVVAVSVLDSERESLNQIASSGSGGDRDEAIFVTSPEQLVPALTGIIAGSIRFERCNDLDDDCDGKVDEDFPGIGVTCDDGDKGVCKGEGVIGCNAAEDGTECKIANPGGNSSDEECNSLDDDCDGKVDEAPLDCDDTPCTPTGAEVCNAVDDDCDGKVDESDPNLDHECGLNRGECTPGRQRCVAGMLTCVGDKKPTSEVCNGKDDDCDGEIDEEAPCPVGNMCIEGACRRECDPDIEFPCPVGYLCKLAPNSAQHYCLPGACALCKSTEICQDDRCVDPCEGVSCEDNETCVLGSCKDCRSIPCTGGRICYEGVCQEDQCAGVDCARTEFCFKGECLPLCDESKCATGERCGPSGTCERDRCSDVTCDDGEVCRGGRCTVDPCAELECTSGDVCVGELGCVADPCVLTVCPGGASCVVGEQGQPICVGTAEPPPPPKRYVSGGGSGLSTCSLTRPGAGSRTPAIGWLLVPALVWSLRRKRAKRGSQSARGA